MADVAGNIPEVAHCALVLAHLERTSQWEQPAGAGIKKIRLAWPERDRGATLAARC